MPKVKEKLRLPTRCGWSSCTEQLNIHAYEQDI
jgi:hypothetical protein